VTRAVVAVLLALLTVDAAGASRHDGRRVRGLDGQHDLIVDAVRMPGLHGAPTELVGGAMRAVRALFPAENEHAYDRLATLLSRRSGAVRLSQLIRKRTGLCREKAFALAALLEQHGYTPRVRYGQLFDAWGRDQGGHAWVELQFGEERLLLDPQLDDEPRTFTNRTVEVLGPDGVARRRRVKQSGGRIYLATNDLFTISEGK
jgi:hypothetical protein